MSSNIQKNSIIKAAAFAASCGLSAAAYSAPVDLSTWTSNNMGSSSWTVQNAPANDSVLQTVNGNPTVFFESGTNAQGVSLSGNIKVNTNYDDDYIGFVLGYDNGELGSSSTDFILVDWKQGNQGGCGGLGAAGLAISRVTNSSTACNYWTHTSGVTELKRGTNLGSTGWADNTSYGFAINFTASLIEVFVDNVLEISLTAAEAGIAAFDNGAFGFYNYSQSNVLYSAITEDPVVVKQPNQVSEPATFAVWGAGILGFAAARRRAKKA